jgi:ABC-type long-subunit fatty acid transport system fused permease/ATPase subunit
MGTRETLVSWFVPCLIWSLFATLFLQEVNERIAISSNKNGETNGNIPLTYADLSSEESTMILSNVRFLVVLGIALEIT